MNNDDKCVMCGRYIPEGRQICPMCESLKSNKEEDFSYLSDIQLAKCKSGEIRDDVPHYVQESMKEFIAEGGCINWAK